MHNHFAKEINQWTLIHMILGIIMLIMLKFFNLSFWSIFIIGNIIHFIYEIKDYILHYYVFKNNIPYTKAIRTKIKNKYNFPFMKFMLGEFPPNNFLNSVFDQIGFATGIIIANLFIKNVPKYISLFFIGLFLCVYSMKFINFYFLYKNNHFNALQD